MANFTTYKHMMEVIDANPDLPIYTCHGLTFRGAEFSEFKKEPRVITTYERVLDPGCPLPCLKLVKKEFPDWREYLKHRYEHESYLEVTLLKDRINIHTYSENDMY